MTTYHSEERAYHGYTYPRPGGSSHGEVPSPERLHSSQGFVKGAPPPPQSPYQVRHDQPPPGSSHGYPPPQPPITPLSSSSYPPQPPPSSNTDSNNSYYGLTTPTQELKQIPSPPPSSGGGGGAAAAAAEAPQFTADGVPIVPVGVSGGKMFRCRGYGECDKVFTRSEHLARHVRKHTGERPFPCHCGKAFSRLDNLRQHAATVHADQSALNEAMLNSLAHVHAALSQRANKDQRRRGEVVEVPKNAVERPRQMEQFRKSSQGLPSAAELPYGAYGPPDPHFTVPAPPMGRPRTGGAYEYSYPDGQNPQMIPPPDEAGPSRRPASAGFPSYPPVYYDPHGTRPPTASTSAGDTPSQLPYPYRPMSSSGRDLPIPVHYAESEPPSSAHGPPPQSPMYPHPHMQAAPPQWTSPGAPQHSNYPPPPPPPPPHPSHYPQQEGYHPHYPPPPPEHGHYGPPPPSTAASGYAYTPQPSQPPPPLTPNYYPPSHQQAYPAPPPTASQYPPQPPPQSMPAYGNPPVPPGSGDTQYQFQAPPLQSQPVPSPVYGYTSYDSRKRRSHDFDDGSRKAPRQSFDAQASIAPPAESSRPQEALWLPPTTERRSSLAISALLGSPQQIPRSRPTTADVPPTAQPGYGQPSSSAGYTYGGADSATASSHSMPATPALSNAETKLNLVKVEGDMSMDQKAKALLSQGR